MRVRRRSKGRREPLSAALREFFLSGDLGAAERAARAAGEADAHGFRGLTDLYITPRTGAGHAERWREHADELVAAWIRERPGSRPAAWWRFDAVEPRRVREAQAAYLARLGLLSDGERARLSAGAFDPIPVDAFLTDEGELDELAADGEVPHPPTKRSTPWESESS